MLSAEIRFPVGKNYCAPVPARASSSQWAWMLGERQPVCRGSFSRECMQAKGSSPSFRDRRSRLETTASVPRSGSSRSERSADQDRSHEDRSTRTPEVRIGPAELVNGITRDTERVSRDRGQNSLTP